MALGSIREYFKYKMYLKSLPYSLYKFENVENFTKRKEKKALKMMSKRSKNITQRTYIVPTHEGRSVTVYTYERLNNHRESSSIVFFIHGGGWGASNWSYYHHYCKHLASVLDALIVSLDYHVSPEYKFPTQIDDCYYVLSWLENACEYWQIDKDRIYLYGESSGANIASVVSRIARDRKHPRINGQILVTPITDARLETKSYTTYKETPTLTKEHMRDYLDLYLNDQSEVFNPSVSPLLVNANFLLPKTFIISAEYDPLHDDADLYAKQLLSANVPCLYYECPKAYHNFIFSKYAPNIKEIEYMMNLFISGAPIERIISRI